MAVLIGSLEIDSISQKTVLELISRAIEQQRVMQVVTPYSEFVVEAETNLDFRRAINGSDLRLADGMGILWAGVYLEHTWNLWASLLGLLRRDIRLYSVFPEKISGSDIIYPLLDMAQAQKLRVYLLGASQQVSLAVKNYIQAEYPRVVITGRNTQKISLAEMDTLRVIQESHSDLVFVALSYPLQEIWAAQLKEYFIQQQHKGVIICLGGSFDFLVGYKRRAPVWMRNIGLEWLYRLAQQPSRLQRMYKATVRFVKLIHAYKLKQTKPSA